MDILSRVIDGDNTIDFKKILNERIERLVAPSYFSPSAMSYGEYMSSLGYYIHSRARDIILEVINQMDEYFFKLKGRSKFYYSKGYRKRQIITIFGEITYYRHEYVDLDSRKPFIYVDEKLGLHRKDRYDPCICALIYERYGYINSMIKVGKDIGCNIDTPFDLSKDRLIKAIPRQTVWKILHRFRKIDEPTVPKKDTPDTVYVMADEKFIASQYNNKEDLMVKEAIVHEGIKAEEVYVNDETGEVHVRNSLINPRRIICLKDEDIYKAVNDYIDMAYDSERIRMMYLMGDGGSWISAGKTALSSCYYPVKCGLDRYHLLIAVNTISKDEEEKKKLYSCAIGNRRKDFDSLIEKIIQNDQERSETIKDKADYIANHFKEIRTMYKEIRIGCAMEQAISHDLSSQFSSVPKAYSPKWLPFYLNLRQNYLNGYDLRRSYLAALDKVKGNSQGNEISLEEHLITSFFDSQIKEETYTLTKKPLISVFKHYN